MAGKPPCGKKIPANDASSNCNTINCLNCPLCYSFTIASFLSHSNLYRRTNTQYSDIEEKLISDYFNKAWKPPDAI